MNFEEYINSIKIISAVNYGKIVNQLGKAARSRKSEEIQELRYDYESIEKLFYILQDIKYMPIFKDATEKAFCINGLELVQMLNNIHDRPDVLIFFRDSALLLIDYYLNMRLVNWLLKKYFSSKHEKKTSSFYYFVMKDIEKYDFEKP